MKKFIVLAMAGLLLAGCQPKESSNQAESVSAERKDAAKKLTAEGLMLLEQKNYQGAVSALDAAVKADPSNQDPYLILSQILLKAGEYRRAADFLDNASRNFPDDGLIFYMLAIANRMDGKKLPAVLAARRSYEIFKNANNAEDAQRSAVLLQQIINSPDAK